MVRHRLLAASVTALLACHAAPPSRSPAQVTTTMAVAKTSIVAAAPISNLPTEANPGASVGTASAKSIEPLAEAPPSEPPQDAAPASAPPALAGPATSKDDGVIAAELSAIAENELDRCRVASYRALEPRLRGLAALIVADVGDANTRLEVLERKRGISPSTTPRSDHLEREGRRGTRALRRASYEDFDGAYLALQLAQGQHELGLVTALAEQAGDPVLKAYLEGRRDVLDAHLREAEAIKSTSRRSTPATAHLERAR